MVSFKKEVEMWTTKKCPVCGHFIVKGEWTIDAGWSAYASVLQVRDIHLRCVEGFEEIKDAIVGQGV